MSSIGSVGSTSAAQYLKKLSGSSSCSQTDDAGAQDDLENDVEAAGSTVDYQDLRSQIEAALKTALSGATSNSDPSATAGKIKDAITSTLTAAGIDPAKLKDALQADFGAPQAGGPPPGPPPKTGAHGAKQEGQDLLALLDSIQSSSDDTSSLDALLGSTGGTSGSNGSATDLGAILDGTDSSADNPFGSSDSSSDDWLSQLYTQLFKNFPNGSGLDTTA